MNKQFMELLEISQIESAQGRIEELDRFLDITRSFSMKCSGHLKVITNLVNNLIESEDWLELVDSDLRLPDRNKEETHTANTSLQHKPSLSPLMSNLKSENEKILKLIERGESNTTFLHDLMGKLLSSLHPDLINKSNQSKRTETHIEEIHEDDHQCCGCRTTPPRDASQDVGGSDSNLKGGDVGSEGVWKKEASRLREENEFLRKELEGLKAREKKEGEGLNEMLKKLMEVKMESERKIRDRDRKLEDLNGELNRAEERAELAERENGELKKNNEILEDTIREVLQSKGPTGRFDGQAGSTVDAVISALKDENASLKQNQGKNERLEEKLKAREKELESLRRENREMKANVANSGNVAMSANVDKKDKVTLDFLKCCYNQAAYIEDFLSGSAR